MVESIEKWLEELDLTSYRSAFSENEITFGDLTELTEADLKEMGLPIGPRRRALRAIRELLEQRTGLQDVKSPERPVVSENTSIAERRQLTVMFCDLVGSTELSTQLDPEDMNEVLRVYQNTVTGEISRVEGHVAKLMGDGVLAYFGWPVAHEDEAERAVRAGLGVVDAVANLHGAGQPLSCRVGIATGLVVVGERVGEGAALEEMVAGETPNIAARLQSLAGPGQVIIAQSTAELVGSIFTLDDIGPQQLKGISTVVKASRVRSESMTPNRFEARRGSALSPMVGRDQELELLLERWQQAKEGYGQGVLLVGEAGIGKSKIVRALIDSLECEKHVRIRYQCSPYHTRSALWPVIQQLSHAARLDKLESIEDKLNAMEQLVTDLGADRALLTKLVGLDPTSRYGPIELDAPVLRTRTFEALHRQLLELIAVDPVLMVLEDAHWIDPTTLEWIGQCLDSIQSNRVLCVVTTRPDNSPKLAAHPHVTRLTLNRLGHSGVEAIIARMAGKSLSRETVAAIVARTDGVPLFVEELTKAVVESNAFEIPTTLHDSLMARLDSVPEVREVAQTAACIGREFSFRLLAELADRPEPELLAALDKLVSAELIFRRGAKPDTHYVFKHALVRDSAYQSLLRQRRQILHARLLKCLEASGDAAPEVLAHHAEAAGLTEQAIQYRSEAADDALRSSANLEAIGHYEAALRIIGGLPHSSKRDQTELVLRLGLGAASIAPKSYASEDVRAAFARAVELCDENTSTDLRFRALRGLWNWHLLRASLNDCARLATTLDMLAEKASDSAFPLMALRIQGTTDVAFSRYRLAKDNFTKGLQLYDSAEQGRYVLLFGEDPGVFCQLYCCWMEDWLGLRDTARDRLEHMLERVKNLDHRYSQAFALALAASVFAYQRDYQRVEVLTREAMTIAEECRAAQWLAYAKLYHGWANGFLNDPEAGAEECEEAFREWQSLGLQYEQPRLLATIAELYHHMGKDDLALKSIHRAVEFIEATDYRHCNFEVYRLRGCLRGANGHSVDAEADLLRAIEMAGEQCVKTFELRAARDLATHWVRKGERRKAHDLLAPVYEWFTEGLDTLDLVEAKTLLDDLQ